MIQTLLIAFIVALVSALALTPMIARLARRFGVVDAPDGHRKLHSNNIPLAGGPSVLVSVGLAVLATWLIAPNFLESTRADRWFFGCMFSAAAVIVLIGVLDDRFKLRGRQKLVGQIIAALVMLPSGIIIRDVSIFGYTLHFGDFAAIVTVLWIVGAINALNLIDGVDGLACTTGIVLSISIAAAAWIKDGSPDGLLVAITLAGALCGFLVFNFPPARMFLGDSGSMLIGLFLGTIAVKCSIKQHAVTTLILPSAIWAIPIFDVSMAIVRRKLTGRSIYATDHGHLHHCLQRRGHSGGRLLVVMALLCGLTGAGAVASFASDSDWFAVVAVITALSLLVLTRSFGHTEMRLMAGRLARLATSMLHRPSQHDPAMQKESTQFNGNHDWEDLWETLTEFAQTFDMDSVELLVNLPLIGEEYHARWKRPPTVEQHEAWRCEIPLIVDSMRVGHIRIVGAAADGSICEWMSELIGGLRPFERELGVLVRRLREERLAPVRLPPRPAVPVGTASGLTPMADSA